MVREEARIRAEGQGIDPHIVQLRRCRGGWMADAAPMAQDTGADIVDINMGCPGQARLRRQWPARR